MLFRALCFQERCRALLEGARQGPAQVCFGLVLFVGSIFLLGWNERRGASRVEIQGSFKGDIEKDIDVDVDVEVDVDAGIDRYFGCLKGLSKPVQVLLNCLEAVMVLTLIILK